VSPVSVQDCLTTQRNKDLSSILLSCLQQTRSFGQPLFAVQPSSEEHRLSSANPNAQSSEDSTHTWPIRPSVAFFWQHTCEFTQFGLLQGGRLINSHVWIEASVPSSASKRKHIHCFDSNIFIFRRRRVDMTPGKVPLLATLDWNSLDLSTPYTA